MRIVSDNPELLSNLYRDMKKDNLEVKKITKKEEGAQDIIGTFFALDITYDRIVGYIEFLDYVRTYSPYLLKTMYVETRDGTKVPYLEYVDMPDEDRAKFFRKDIV